MTSRAAIEARVAKILVEHLGVSEGQIRPDVRLQPEDKGGGGLNRRRHIEGEDLDADSLDVVELVMALEEEFGISIPDDDAEALNTVKDVVDYVEANAESGS